jgi:hypothetical protein|tara:strand:+ start:196 stop:360 length:165 start_codon:yes stop_codon:yes gene_type:complete
VDEEIEEEYYSEDNFDDNSIPERSDAMMDSSINIANLDPKKDLTKKENAPGAIS